MPPITLSGPSIGSGAVTTGGPMGFDPGSAAGGDPSRSKVEPFFERDPNAWYVRPRWFRSVQPTPSFYGGIGGFDNSPPPTPGSQPRAGGGVRSYFKGGGNQPNPFGNWLVDALSREGVWTTFSYAGYLSETPNLKNYAPSGIVPGRQDLYLGSRFVYSAFYNVNPGEGFRPIRSRFVPSPTAPAGPDIQDPNSQRRRGVNPPGFLNPGATPGIFPGASPGTGRSASPGAGPGASPSPNGRTSPPPVQAPSPPPAPIGDPPPAIAPPPPAISPTPKPPGSPQFPGARPSGPPATQIPGGQSQNRSAPPPAGLILPPPVPVTPPGSAPIRNGAPAPAPAPDPRPTPTPNFNCSADPCITNIAATQSQQSQKLDRLLNGLGLAGQATDLALLTVINNKLGPQIPGGISGKLQRFAASTKIDKLLNALTFITVLHNASMLSTSLAASLGEVTSQALAAIGLKDDDNNPFDVNSIISQAANDFMKSILGEQLWTGVVQTWHKLNRIVSSATNIMWSLRSMFDSAREVAEWTAENTGKIGNALKRFRIVGENAYKWMPEQVNSGSAVQRRWDRIRNGLEDLDDTASSLSGVLSEVNSIQEEFDQLKEQKEEFDKSIKESLPKDRPDNDSVKEKADSSNAASKSPDISTSDRNQEDTQ